MPVRSGLGRPLAPEHRDKPGASSYQQDNPENKGGDVKRAGARARGDEHDRPISYQPDTMVPALGVVGGTPGWAVRRIITRRSPPASHASHSFAVLAPLRDRLHSRHLPDTSSASPHAIPTSHRGLPISVSRATIRIGRRNQNS